MGYTFKIKDIELNMEDMAAIDRVYKAFCTAEYILDEYPEIAPNEEKALTIGFRVREIMDDHAFSEDEAINVYREVVKLKEFFLEDF